MLTIIAVLVFVVVTLGVFALGSLLDQRRSRARLLRDRLASVQRAAERQPSEELALLRDELLSEIPVLNTILSRSSRISSLQKLLSQADIKTRAGNFLMICAGSAFAIGVIIVLITKDPLFAWVGMLVGFFLPYSYASYQKGKRFQKFEELFPLNTCRC